MKKNKNISDDSESYSDTQESDIESQMILDEANYIGPFTDKLIKDFIHEIRKEKNMDRIRENVLDPVLCDINDRYFPHMVTLITLLILIVLLLTLLLLMNFSDRKNKTTS
jgi:hypothetical protein